MAGSHELVPMIGVTAACRALGVPRSTYYRAQRPAAPSFAISVKGVNLRQVQPRTEISVN